ncbi:MAG TPA: hypothetical protein GX747_01305 [Tenericutes bacterium]|nr:hypothetical protein [Mycoplasmatota bacterium]
MKKRFKAKKGIVLKLRLKYALYIVLIYVFYQLGIYIVLNVKLVDSNEKFIMNMLSNSNYHIMYEKKEKNLFNKFFNYISNINLEEPLTIFNTNVIFKESNKRNPVIVNDYTDDYSNMEELSKITSYITDPNPTDVENPLIYIYNSHPLENYSNQSLELYNITPNVMMTSYMLKEKLNKIGLPTIVEDGNLTEFMRINNWTHKDSYKASRIYLVNVKNKYPSLKLFIDIHRDSIKKNASTIKINNKEYAKVLFVVGLEHKNKDTALKVANSVNAIVNSKYKGLSRGVITKGGAGVDGIYNQDFHPNMILLEIGGYQNTIEEILNTVEAMSLVIKEYLS